MLIVDFSQVAIAAIMAEMNKPANKNVPLEIDLLRHMILDTIRYNYKKFNGEYGEMVIACDHSVSWRKEVFPQYKANRKKDRDDSKFDWSTIFNAINTVRDELQENFPYAVIKVKGAEADDIIGVLCREYGTDSVLSGSDDKILILSGDKDFRQLQRYSNVSQYNPVGKEAVHVDDPTEFLIEHIIKGDKSDGVPNMLSADDCLVKGVRQTVLTSKRKEALRVDILSGELGDNEKRYNRNKLLIDLANTPSDISKDILEEYEREKNKELKPGSVFNYFMSKKLRKLMESANEF